MGEERHPAEQAERRGARPALPSCRSRSRRDSRARPAAIRWATPAARHAGVRLPQRARAREARSMIGKYGTGSFFVLRHGESIAPCGNRVAAGGTRRWIVQSRRPGFDPRALRRPRGGGRGGRIRFEPLHDFPCQRERSGCVEGSPGGPRDDQTGFAKRLPRHRNGRGHRVEREDFALGSSGLLERMDGIAAGGVSHVDRVFTPRNVTHRWRDAPTGMCDDPSDCPTRSTSCSAAASDVGG